MAEAYNSRGIAKIALGQKNQGCVDLIKAAKLGYKEARILLKKYCKK